MAVPPRLAFGMGTRPCGPGDTKKDLASEGVLSMLEMESWTVLSVRSVRKSRYKTTFLSGDAVP